jgi:hypothetical protein
MIEGFSSPIAAECKSASELTFIMPKFDTVGKHSITLLPPSGVPLQSSEDIEIAEVGQGGYVAPKEESVDATDSKIPVVENLESQDSAEESKS